MENSFHNYWQKKKNVLTSQVIENRAQLKGPAMFCRLLRHNLFIDFS